MKRLMVLLLLPAVLISCKQNNKDEKQTQNSERSKKEVQADIKESTHVKKGQEVPDFTFTTTEGEEYSIQDLQEKVVLLNFFATWCPTCMKEMPALQEQIWEKYRDNKDFFLVSIGREQNMNKMKEFKKEKGYDFNFAPDTGRVIYGKFAEKYIPRNVVINEEGTIVYQNTGYKEEEFLQMMNIIEKELED
ncbi:MAG: TlpA family protein disulfide reductase [Bacteroidales bacterium]|nr:TlpA family protein disulfide reductase [Bacteroidales bacterium]